MLKTAAIFAGGVVVGLLIAKQYAKIKTESAIGDALDKVGLGGGIIQDYATRLIVPSVAG